MNLLAVRPATSSIVPAIGSRSPTWIDDVLADSFPASDPPSWTPGIATVALVSASIQALRLPRGSPLLQKGDLVPHFTVTDLNGKRFAYSDIWQRKNVVFVSLPSAESAASTSYLSRLAAHMGELTGPDTAFVVSRDAILGLPAPGVVVGDRWGEIHHITHAAGIDDLPGPDELVEWLRYVQRQCPECEGEAK